MRNCYSFITTFLVLALCACQKKELPVKAHDPGNVTTATANMDATYKYQVYYSLKTNTVIGQNLKTIWDIGCETSASGFHIALNAAKSMFAFNTGKTDFSAVGYVDTIGFSVNKKWDAPTGNMDSTAIGNWRITKPVYIIDRGYDESGNWQGMEKLQLMSVTDSCYIIRAALLNGSGDVTLSVRKDSMYNLSFVSFTSNQQVVAEPPKANWDLVFTQYTFIFYDNAQITPYLVTGCLLNRNKTNAAKDTGGHFEQIKYGDVSRYTLSGDVGTIGYDWKVFNGTAYTINTKYSYVIETAEGLFYKLHFTGFYNSSGTKGNPKWEYQQL